MEKITKHYINEYIMGREWVSRELSGISSVDELNPELMNIDSKSVTRIRFFEQSFVKDGEDIYVGKAKPLSPIYCFGQRISAEEALELCSEDSISNDYVKNNIRMNPNVTFCKTDLGYLEVLSSDCITMSEYLASKKTLN